MDKADYDETCNKIKAACKEQVISIPKESATLFDSRVESIWRAMSYLLHWRTDVEDKVTYNATVNPETGTLTLDSFTVRFKND